MALQELKLSRFVRRGQRLAGKVMVKARKVGSMLTKPDATELMLDTLRSSAGRSAELSGKIAVVTGSTRGIGRAVSFGFAERGACVVINGRSESQVTETVAALKAQGGTAIGVCADVATPAGVKTLLDSTIEAFGRVDILVNNAAIFGKPGKRLWEHDRDEQAEVIRVNLIGPMLCASATIEWMLANKTGGRIINVSSGAGETAVPKMGPYGISKFGLEGLTKYMAADLGLSGISVTTVQPGSIRTDMTKEAFGWAEAQALPDPEGTVPTFVYAATAPAELVHGRVVSIPRYSGDPFAESRLSGPAAMTKGMTFQGIEFKGEAVDRASGDFAIYDRAENQLGVTPKVRQTLQEFGRAQPIHLYPDPNYSRLRRALAEEHNLPESCFVIGNGSSELISRLIQLFVKAGEMTISNGPGWFGFDVFGARVGANRLHVPFVLNGAANRAHHNLDEILQAIDVNTRLIYLINPSNPEGVPLRSDAFQAFLERVPEHLPVIIDEAYYEYGDDPEMVNAAEWVLRTDRTVIGLRTFSKFYGLAGMRVGYGFAKPEVIELVSRLGLAFNISAAAEEAAVSALADRSFRDGVRVQVAEQRNQIQAEFRRLGVEYVPSQSAFILVERPRGDLLEFYKRFESERIFLSRGSFFDDKYVLFPVGTPEQNRHNLRIFESFF